MPGFEQFNPTEINSDQNSPSEKKAELILGTKENFEPELEAEKLHDQIETLHKTLGNIEVSEFPRFQTNILQTVKEWWIEQPKRERQRNTDVQQLLSSEETLTQAIHSDNNFGGSFDLMNRLMEKQESFEEWETVKKGKQMDFYSTRLHEFGANLALKNVRRIEEFLQKPERYKTGLAAKTLGNMIVLGKDRLVRDNDSDLYSTAMRALEENLGSIQKEIETQQYDAEGHQDILYDCSEVLKIAVQYGNPEMVEKASRMLSQLFRTKQKEGEEKYFADSSIKNLVNVAFGGGSEKKESSEQPIELLAHILQDYGLNPARVGEAWQLGAPAERRAEVFWENLMRVRSLEWERPQITTTLLQKFGIRNFARYSKELLIQQFDEQDKNMPYGVALYPTDDWNGAFYGNTESKVFLKLKDQLNQRGYTLRILEAKGKIEAAKSLVRLDENYGQDNKISFGIIGAHGNKNIMVFGNSGEQGALQTQDFSGTGVQKVGDFFVEKPVIILNSCMVGQDKGLAEKLSKTYKAKVIASDIASSVKSIEVKDIENGIDFDVDFEEGKGKIFNPENPGS